MVTLRYPAKITKTYLFKLSIPIFFSNLVIPLTGLVDTALMGHQGEAKFLAATSIATSVITMIFWSFGFLRMGTVGLVAQALGKGDYREIVYTTIRNLGIALFIGLIILFLKHPILFAIEHFFNTSDDTQFLISKYISIRLLSAPAELSMYVLVGLYLGLQMTKHSSLIISTFCILNIVLSIYFVSYLGLSIAGVALGTVISAYISIFISLLYTYLFIKKKFNIIPRYRKIYISRKLLKLFNINFDIFIRTTLITFAFLWFIYQSSLLGEDYLAINTILLQFITLAAFILDAYAFSTEGVVGYSLGRKVLKSFMMTVNNSIKLSFFTGLVISLIYLIFFKQLINALTDLEFLRYLSYGFIFWVILMPPVASFCYQFDGIFIGTSQTKEMRNSMIFSVAIFIITTNFLVKEYNNDGLWFSLLLFMIMRSLSLRIFFNNITNKF